MATKLVTRLRVLVVASILILIVLEYCSGQTLTDRNTNTISDRSFQNTLLSRRPITPTGSSGINRAAITTGGGTNNGRIRVIQLPLSQTSGQTGSRSGIRIRPVQSTRQRIITPDRQIRLRQSRVRANPDRTGIRTSRRTTIVRPTGSRSLNRLRQTGGLPGSIRRRAMSRQTTRRISRNRQIPRPGVQFRPGPLRRDPQTGLLIQSISAQPRRSVSNREPRAIGPIPRCASNARYTCRAFPRNGDRRRARRCVGFCGRRRCVGLCLCACVTNRSTNRLREQIGQVRPRNRLIDQLASGATPNDLNFTVDNSILARMLAKPDLNTLVGPDGINQILRGEPPVLRITEPPVASIANISSLRPTTQAPIDMGVPIPLGLTPAPLGIDPLLANMLTSGEAMGEMTSEIGSEVLRIPSLTEFQRPGSGAVMSLNANSVSQPELPATNLDANFFGAILPMPTPISTSRDPQKSRSRTKVVVNPSLLDSGVIEPVRGFKSAQRPLSTLKAQSRVLENAFDIQTFDSISDVLSGAAGLRESGINLNMLNPGNSAVRGSSRDRRFFDSVLRSSGNQEPSETAIMAAMMQSLGGAVDAVSAANSRNRTNSASTGTIRSVSESSSPMNSTNQTGNLIQNFLTGTVKATDHSMAGPTVNECFAQGREFWCDPIGVWESTPGISRWCRTNCGMNSNLCDQARCDCKCVELERFRRNTENLRNL